MIAFIEPPQGDVIEKILRGHQSGAMVGGVWHAWTPRSPPAREGWVHDPQGRFGQPDGIFRRASGADLRGHGHILGHFLILTDGCRPGDGACGLRDPPQIGCPVGAGKFPSEAPNKVSRALQERAAGQVDLGGHGRPDPPAPP